MAVERTFRPSSPTPLRRTQLAPFMRFEEAGLKIVAARMMHLSEAQAGGFYAEHAERPFFKIVAFMTSGPVVVQVLEGRVRWLRTASSWAPRTPEAAPGTIRADFAESIDANAVHGSDSTTSAARVAYFQPRWMSAPAPKRAPSVMAEGLTPEISPAPPRRGSAPGHGQASGGLLYNLGEKPFRAVQVMKWLHHRDADDFATMTDFPGPPGAARGKPPWPCLRWCRITNRWTGPEVALRLADGQRIETVFIPEKDRAAYISSRWAAPGAAAPREAGQPNLTAAEIVSVRLARRPLQDTNLGRLSPSRTLCSWAWVSRFSTSSPSKPFRAPR